MRTGPRNLLTDVCGLTVGNAEDASMLTGVTAVVCDDMPTAAVQVLGGAPGTRETDMLRPEIPVRGVNAIVLSGGSAFGLEAASGVMEALSEDGRGLAVGPALVPLVPSAIIFDLMVGDKPAAPGARYRALGREAYGAASDDFALGSAGAGMGATTANLRGGLGSASTRLSSGHTVAALIVANPIGQATIGESGRFWAAPFEIGDEFGGLGMPFPLPADSAAIRHKLAARALANTAIAVVATDAVLTKPQATRLALSGHTGVARAIWPSHTVADGDTVFALATGRMDAPHDTIELEACAAACLSRATARAIFLAAPMPGHGPPAWCEVFG